MAKRNELGQFIAVFRGSYRSIKGGLVAVGLAFLIGGVIGLLQGGLIENLASAGSEIVLIAMGLVALLLLYAKYHAVRIYTHGIEGKSYWSLPVRFLWDRIDQVRLDSSNGISAVVLTEQGSGREMWIFRDVFFREDFQRSIRPYLDVSRSVE